MALGEYFTEDEFRELVQDNDAPQKYETADITRAHDEVVKRFELWARSSWVTREWSIFQLTQHGYLNLSRTPVQQITAFSVAGQPVTAGDYLLDEDGGRIMWGDWSMGVPILDEPMLAEVTWDYGFGFTDPADIDWEIKRPVILASGSLLKPQKEKAKIPPNTRSFSTSRASFDLRFERAQTRPWPWDEAMSSQVRSAWEPFRSRMYMS